MKHGLLVGLSFIGCRLRAHEAFLSSYSDIGCRDTVCCRVAVDNDSLSVVDSSKSFVANATGYIVGGSGIALSGGKNAAEILKLLPGVKGEGKGFTVNGFPVTEIQVDGFAIRGREELELVSSDDIESIEVDYLSGSDKNVNVAGGVIRVSLKEPRVSLKEPENRPCYGNLRVSGTLSPDYGIVDGNVGGMIFCKGRKWTLYNTTWLNNDCSETEEEEKYNYSVSGENQTVRNFRNFSMTRNAAFMMKEHFCLTYSVDDNNSLTANMFFSNLRSRPEVMTDGYDDVSHTRTMLKSRIDENVYRGTLKYVCALRENDAVFEVNADYMCTDEKTKELVSDFLPESEFAEDAVRGNKKVFTENLWKKHTDLWSAGVSFSRSFAHVGTFKIGASASLVKSVVSPGHGAEAIDRTETKGFTPFVYAMLTGKWRDVSYILGINSQWNRIGFYNRSKGREDENRQWCLNPTLQFVCPLNKEKGHALKVAYKHTMDNIPYDAINTELKYNNVNSYVVGNPFLTAAKSDLAMIVLSLNKGMFRFCGYYDRATDIIKYATYQDEEGGDLFYTMPVNCKSIKTWGFSVEAIINPLRFWRLKASAMIELMKENAAVGELDFNGAHQRYILGVDNDFVFGKGFGGNVCFGFEPTFRSLDRKYHTVLNLQCGVYKSFCNDRLNLALNLNLLRKTRTFDTESSAFTLRHRDMTHGQFVHLAAVWKLGNR
ncbi:MAG: outer membrane beta-barrel protein [Prevotellaceae bacterium]|nr:outer membrane beta-barrel protein [Prevotellaceae bacterium]